MDKKFPDYTNSERISVREKQNLNKSWKLEEVKIGKSLKRERAKNRNKHI